MASKTLGPTAAGPGRGQGFWTGVRIFDNTPPIVIEPPVITDWPIPPPPVLLQTWSQSSQFWLYQPVGKQVTDLPPATTIPPHQVQLHSWTWNYNLNLIGKDKLPYGRWVTDIPSRQLWYQDWSQNLLLTTLSVSAQLPENQYDWPLPQRPYRIDQTWTWSQVGMLGQDQLLVGEQIYDLPVRAPKPIEQTWIWRQVGMLGKDLLVVGQQVYDLPIKPVQRLPLYSWEWRQVQMLGQDILPENQYDWPLPGRPPRIEQTWALNLQLTTLQPTFDIPKNQFDWPLPKVALRIDETWTWRQVHMLNQDTLPFNQYDWPLPRPPSKPGETWAWRQTHMFGQDKVPGKQSYDLTAHRSIRPPIDPTWTWRQVGMIGLDTLPENQYDWPLPQTYPIATKFRAWEWRQVQMLGQDILPTGKQVYDLAPIGPYFSTNLRTWIQTVNLALITSNPIPLNQYDWPLTRAAQQPTITWAWRQVHMLGQDVLPKNQYDHPLPNRGPAQFIRSAEWRQVHMLGKDVLPRNQYDWPLPQQARRDIALNNWVNQAIKQVVTRPFNQYDWPVPRDGRQKVDFLAPFNPNLFPSITPSLMASSVDWPYIDPTTFPYPVDLRSWGFRSPFLEQFNPIPPPPDPTPPNTVEARPVRDFWDRDEWGNFIPGAGIRGT